MIQIELFQWQWGNKSLKGILIFPEACDIMFRTSTQAGAESEQDGAELSQAQNGFGWLI